MHHSARPRAFLLTVQQAQSTSQTQIITSFARSSRAHPSESSRAPLVLPGSSMEIPPPHGLIALCPCAPTRRGALSTFLIGAIFAFGVSNWRRALSSPSRAQQVGIPTALSVNSARSGRSRLGRTGPSSSQTREIVASAKFLSATMSTLPL
jgi:hypothetical protein